jgi:hypothetical protein
VQAYKPEQVINGTWGEVWIDGEYMAEVISFKAEVDIQYADINMTRRLAKAKKMTGYEGKGEVKLNKVTSEMSKKISDNLKQGKQTVCTIISKLDDPNAIGAERIVVKDATFEKLTLADWEAKKNGEEALTFSFTDWDFLDLIQ